jgi:hypothetical protein
MSAFIVSKECIDRVVFAILGPHAAQSACNKLGRALSEMNARAMTARYGDSDGAPDASAYVFEPSPVSSRAVSVKAIRCLIYQCTEGDVSESELYKSLEARGNELCVDIVCASDEYKGAPWG